MLPYVKPPQVTPALGPFVYTHLLGLGLYYLPQPSTVVGNMFGLDHEDCVAFAFVSFICVRIFKILFSLSLTGSAHRSSAILGSAQRSSAILGLAQFSLVMACLRNFPKHFVMISFYHLSSAYKTDMIVSKD